LLQIAGNHRLIKSIVVGRGLPIDPQIELHGAAAHLLPDEGFHLAFEGRIAFAGPEAELEIAVVDAAHLDRDG
jgi:hypothetical protein